jgi:hypothetical protein
MLYTKTLAYPKTLAPLKSLADGKNLVHPKSLADSKNLAHPKSLADGKNLAPLEKYWHLQKCWRIGKTRRPPMLAQQEKLAGPLKNCLTVKARRNLQLLTSLRPRGWSCSRPC